MADQPILELKNVYSSYGSIKALKGISLKVLSGRDRGHHRRQRSRQIHHPDDHLLRCPHRQRARSCTTAQAIHGTAAEALPKAGLCQVPEGRRIFPAADR
jgi:branched-chain amino acid transport system ATP-binding protein